STQFWPFCCGKCHGRLTGTQPALGQWAKLHGPLCERHAAPREVPAATFSPTEQELEVLCRNTRAWFGRLKTLAPPGADDGFVLERAAVLERNRTPR
ncbi:unnamed protein product, partial [Prorocentrum cordatum]